MNFQKKLDAIVKKNNLLLCVDLDQGEKEPWGWVKRHGFSKGE